MKGKNLFTHRENFLSIGLPVLVAIAIGVLSLVATLRNPDRNSCLKNDMLEGRYRKILFSD